MRDTLTIAQRLKVLIDQRGLSQEAAAKEAGMSTGALKKYLQGRSGTQFEKMGILCRNLNISPNRLLNFDEDIYAEAALWAHEYMREYKKEMDTKEFIPFYQMLCQHLIGGSARSLWQADSYFKSLQAFPVGQP